MSTQALSIFSGFVNEVAQITNYQQILLDYENHYNLRKFKITEIPVDSSFSMFQHIVEKFYKNHSPGESSTWVQNQLRLYLWAIICYLEIRRKTLLTMDKEDWDFFAKMFFVKEYSLFEYQARILLDESIKVAKWSEEEDYMLYCIIVKDKNAKWNQIAKSLFITSNKEYLRASKQCRQRWLNHLDPSKSKSQWTLRQYLIMFEQVEQKGKKWAILVKILKDRRSEHSIKNKYNSIIKKQQRLTPNLTEEQILREMIVKINRIIETNHIEPKDQYLFGCSIKLLGSEQKNKKDINQKNVCKPSPEEIQHYKTKFLNFRKKIEMFQGKNTKQSQNQKTQLRPGKKLGVIKEVHLSAPVTRKKQLEVRQEQTFDQDQIFYDQSFQVDEVFQPQFNFSVICAEDFKSMINQDELDL